MDERDILDVPDSDKKTLLHFSRPLMIVSVIGFTLIFSLFFWMEVFKGHDNISINLSLVTISMQQLSFLFLVCFGLYVFVSFIQYELHHWFRIMTVSISVIFIALLMAYFVGYKSVGLGNNDPFQVFKSIVFIALVAGGGGSIAVQFLRKKKYLIFTAVMICTIFLFSFVDKV